MKRIILTLAVLTMLSFAAAPAMASDYWSYGHSNFHHNQNHRAARRYAIHDSAHYYGISPRNHYRLHRNLNHDAYHDYQNHNNYHYNSYGYGNHGIGIHGRRYSFHFGF